MRGSVGVTDGVDDGVKVNVGGWNGVEEAVGVSVVVGVMVTVGVNVTVRVTMAGVRLRVGVGGV